MAEEELFISDPKRYARMREPWPDAKSADDAFAAFHKELGELREKYKITDFIAAGSGFYIDDGEEVSVMLPMFWGNWLHAEALAAYLFGREQSNRQVQIGKILGGSPAVRDLERKR